MLTFHRGFERVIKGIDVPDHPGQYGRHLGIYLQFLQRPLSVEVAASYPVSRAHHVRQATSADGYRGGRSTGGARPSVDAFLRRRVYMRTLTRSFLKTARRNPRHFSMADGRTPTLSFGEVLLKTIFPRGRLRPLWRDQKMVGVFLPPSIPGAVVNWAALLLGKAPINLNYTTSAEALASCAVVIW